MSFNAAKLTGNDWVLIVPASGGQLSDRIKPRLVKRKAVVIRTMKVTTVD